MRGSVSTTRWPSENAMGDFIRPSSSILPTSAPEVRFTFGAPADYDFRRPKAEDLASQAFTLDLDADGPIEVARVVEQRQITLGRPVYADMAAGD